MESRKFKLQKQIQEALKANDNDLYFLLKSQWAHRFGVESLEELQNLDLSFVNQTPSNEDNQKNDQTQNDLLAFDKEISINNDDSKEKEITNKTKKFVKTVEPENQESFEVKSYEIVENKHHEHKTINKVIENKTPPKLEALIPLPPKPKYSYLNKWLLRS